METDLLQKTGRNKDEQSFTCNTAETRAYTVLNKPFKGVNKWPIVFPAAHLSWGLRSCVIAHQANLDWSQTLLRSSPPCGCSGVLHSEEFLALSLLLLGSLSLMMSYWRQNRAITPAWQMESNLSNKGFALYRSCSYTKNVYVNTV